MTVEHDYTIRGTPAQFVRLVIEVGRKWDDSHERMIANKAGLCRSGAIYVYDFTPGGAGVTIRINADGGGGVGEIERSLNVTRYGWIDARSIVTEPGKGESTRLTVTLPWPIDDSSAHLGGIWALVYGALEDEGLIVSKDDAPGPVIDGDTGTDGQPAREDPFAKWDPNTVKLIEQLSKDNKRVAFIVTETGVAERTVIRIRAALAKAKRIKRRNDP